MFSLLSLPFITQMPTLADDNLGIDPKSTQYGFLYACFGLGAVVGALSIGTVLVGPQPRAVMRVGLVAFAGFLAVFSLLRAPGARPIRSSCCVGLAYFAVITSLSTVLQQRPRRRATAGKVMALWIMGFGGTVPFGGLIGGGLIERTSVTAVVHGRRASFALALAVLRRPQPVGRRTSPSPPPTDRPSPRPTRWPGRSPGRAVAGRSGSGGGRPGARGRRPGCP